MINFWDSRNSVKAPKPGAEFADCLAEAITESDTDHRRRRTGFAFSYGKVIVRVKPDSDPTLITRDFIRATDRLIDGEVGPYPPLTLSADDIAADDRRRRANVSADLFAR